MFCAELTVDRRPLGLWESLKDELRTVEFCVFIQM